MFVDAAFTPKTAGIPHPHPHPTPVTLRAESAVIENGDGGDDFMVKLNQEVKHPIIFINFMSFILIIFFPNSLKSCLQADGFCHCWPDRKHHQIEMYHCSEVYATWFGVTASLIDLKHWKSLTKKSG